MMARGIANRWKAAVATAVISAGCGGTPTRATPATPGGSAGARRTDAAFACASGDVVHGEPDLVATLVGEGFADSVDVQTAPGDRDRLFVVEQGGRIVIQKAGERLAEPFLDIQDRVGATGEQGLLGLAFHPKYASNGRFFVHYVDRDGVINVSEFPATADPDLADATLERHVLTISKHYANHNGGRLAFGPDGLLYVGVGDGGSKLDEEGNAQNLGSLLGKILRIDVDHGLDEDLPYSVPADNPFVGVEEARPEVWALGLRNPWRFAFDPATDEIYVGDVGERDYEELNVAPHGGKGANYGWNLVEGPSCLGGGECDMEGLAMPFYSYGRDEGRSVIGGQVYRGCRMPGYSGTYFFGDFMAPFVRSIRADLGAASLRDWSDAMPRVTLPVSFGTDAFGEILIVDYDGEIFRIDPVPAAPSTAARVR
jgi:hypothetical protein